MKQATHKYLKVTLNLVLALVMLLLVIFVVPKLLVYFLPFVIGALIGAIASPIVKFFEEKLKIRRKAGTVFVIVAVIAIVVLFLYFIISILIEQGIGFVEEFPDLWQRLEGDIAVLGDWLSKFTRKFPGKAQFNSVSINTYMDDLLSEIVSAVTSPTITAVGNFAKQLPLVIIGIIFCLISAYFFVADKKQLSELWNKSMPKAITIRYEMIKRSLSISIGGFIKAQLIIEFWVFLILAAGLVILGVDYVWIIALGIAILDLLPILGTGTALVPWSVVSFIRSDIKMGVGLLVLWGVSQLFRQLIQPKIVGDSVGLPTFATLFLLYVGFRVDGVIGMLLAIPVGIVAYTMYKEGIFDTTINSAKILVNGINNYRRLTKEDLEEIEDKNED
ncbi:MAG: sporulation integral membrane protein YtvI [Lachnospiraceae bacterium]|nr:sporulation integral membrane protein YtvI [Lachnospiraceae bacterium]